MLAFSGTVESLETEKGIVDGFVAREWDRKFVSSNAEFSVEEEGLWSSAMPRQLL